MDDYPAAHSMDTVWFAIDRDGQVACFDSGETGAVPEAWFGFVPVAAAMRERGLWVDHSDSSDPADVLNEAADLLRAELREGRGPGAIVYDLETFLADSPTARRFALPAPGRGPLGPALAVVQAPDLAAEALRLGAAVPMAQVPAGPPWLLRWAELDRRTADRLLGSADCLALVQDGELWPDNFSPALGLFVYDGGGGWVAGPQRRLALPAPPVHVDQLSPLGRALVSRVRFDRLAFHEARLVQPRAWTPCSEWHAEPGYLDVDGRTWRPVPGREAAFAEPAYAAALRTREAEDAAFRERFPAEIDQERRDLRRHLAAWREEPPPAWADRAADAWLAYRANRPGYFRIVLTMADESTAFRACRAYRQEPVIPFGAHLSGRRLVARDHSANHHGVSGGPRDLFRWIGLAAERGQWPFPELTFGPVRPPTELAGFERLWDDLAEVRRHHPRCLEPRPFTLADLDQLRARPQYLDEVLVALVLGMVRQRWRGVGGRWYEVVVRLAPDLTQATPAMRNALERLAAHLPVMPALQFLRLRMTVLLARQGQLDRGSAASVIRELLEAADADLPAAAREPLVGEALAAPDVIPPDLVRPSVWALALDGVDGMAARAELPREG